MPQNKINLDLVIKKATKVLIDHYTAQIKDNKNIEMDDLIPYPDLKLRTKCQVGLTYMSLISRYLGDTGYL